MTRHAAPSVLVAADPEWTPEGKLSRVAIQGVRSLAQAGADNIRLLNFNIFPEMSVAQIVEGVWNFSRMDEVVVPFLEAAGNASVLFDVESSPTWMWELQKGGRDCPARLRPCGQDTCADAARVDLPPTTAGGYGNRLRCPHWGSVSTPRDRTWEELATYFSRVSDWYTKGGFTLPNGTRYSSGHHFKIAFWEIWNEVNLFREHNMSAQTYVEYYDQQVAAMRRSAGGLVSKVGGPSLAGLTELKADEWAAYLLDARNHNPPSTPFDALCVRSPEHVPSMESRLQSHRARRLRLSACHAHFILAPGSGPHCDCSSCLSQDIPPILHMQQPQWPWDGGCVRGRRGALAGAPKGEGNCSAALNCSTVPQHILAQLPNTKQLCARAAPQVQYWRDTLRPSTTLHLTESGLICNSPKGCGGNNYSCWYTDFDATYWLASGSHWLYQYLRSAEAADLATIAQSQILGYPHGFDGESLTVVRVFSLGNNAAATHWLPSLPPLQGCRASGRAAPWLTGRRVASAASKPIVEN